MTLHGGETADELLWLGAPLLHVVAYYDRMPHRRIWRRNEQFGRLLEMRALASSRPHAGTETTRRAAPLASATGAVGGGLNNHHEVIV